ncbi:MAG TPA: nitrate/sulfonate/bicarbonate ABC transporter ATP-binding protein [Gemmataceae bacterium]|jgi:NitT/TauT family transport system ATP-binding protein|nr:nitrate/sulfonate/bicarbonate ABC transporter ATP-binding protein [Gemmataceae bacterium]
MTNGPAGVAPLCELRHVNHDFPQPNGQMRRVLDDINLAVRPNEMIALIGPSGCGKSTVMRILAGLIAPTSGQVFDHDKPLTGINPDVAIVFQSFALLPWLTVADNVRVVLRSAGRPEADIPAVVDRVLTLVGLAGFAEAYPRELSGGMKQRVGIARALAVDPEVLFMDEPFSQVDALTAESLRAEVTDIFQAHGHRLKSILMVSHDTKEVAFLADRIVVLSANPGRIRTTIENPLPRPRDYRAPAFLALVDRLHEIITGAELPDVPAVPTRPPAVEALPRALPNEIVGLLEYLDVRGGREDLFRIANDTARQFGAMIEIVEAAELLDFVDTPKRLVVLDAVGRRYLAAKPEDRPAVWREQLLKLKLFHDVADALKRQNGEPVPKMFVLETLVLHLPQEDYEQQFDTFVQWARFGDLFAYNEATQEITPS